MLIFQISLTSIFCFNLLNNLFQRLCILSWLLSFFLVLLFLPFSWPFTLLIIYSAWPHVLRTDWSVLQYHNKRAWFLHKFCLSSLKYLLRCEATAWIRFTKKRIMNVILFRSLLSNDPICHKRSLFYWYQSNLTSQSQQFELLPWHVCPTRFLFFSQY